MTETGELVDIHISVVKELYNKTKLLAEEVEKMKNGDVCDSVHKTLTDLYEILESSQSEMKRHLAGLLQRNNRHQINGCSSTLGQQMQIPIELENMIIDV
jgi:hypothetical protein